MDASSGSGFSFGRLNFGDAEFGDRRLTRRLVIVADQMAKHPPGTLPDKMQTPKDLKGLYRLMNCETVTHESVLRSHYDLTRRQLEQREEATLLVQDSTELDYTGKDSLRDLGQIGNGSRRGYICHSTLAVVPGSRRVLGLADQILHCREDVCKNESRQQKRSRQNRESRLWQRSSEAIGISPQGRLWVEVCDRGADLFEYLDFKHRQGGHYVVRSKSNRQITAVKDGKSEKMKLHDHARSLPSAADRQLDIPAAKGRAARTAHLSIAWANVQLLPPAYPRGQHRSEPLNLWVVRVWETDPPEDIEPLEWILVTNVQVNEADDALERAEWYSDRWIVEEYHKAMKTGCNIESPQFTSETALEPTIGLIAVVALLLLGLRDQSRGANARERPAREIVPDECVRVISAWRFQDADRELSVHEFFYALARLGGHLNRKGDHRPGWLVLWRGWTQLQMMIRGALALDAL
jgi:hypothetical protein